MKENIVLDSFMRIGDKVVVNWNDTSEGWASRPLIPENDTVGTVIGFTRYQTAMDRSNCRRLKPGIYEHNGGCCVLWEDGTSSTNVSAHDISFLSPILKQERKSDDYKRFKDLFELPSFVQDLPELMYKVGNVVLLKDDYWENDEVIITGVDYLKCHDTCNDGITPYPIYHIRSLTNNRGSTAIRADDISMIISDGNYVAWETDKSKLKFKGLADELAFYQSLGKMNQVRNPNSGNYQWTVPEINKAMHAYEIHAAGNSHAMFGSTPFPIAYKIDEDLPDLIKRVHQKWISDSN